MTVAGWLELVHRCAHNVESQRLLAEYLAEVDVARQALRDKGYGVGGTSITEQVRQVPSIYASEVV